MIIKTRHDQEFNRLIDLLFSFEFPHKEQLRCQIENAIITREQSDYSLVYTFYINSEFPALPESFCGMPLSVDVVYESEYTCCELFVSKCFVSEFRLYNIDGSKLNFDHFWKGDARFELVLCQEV